MTARTVLVIAVLAVLVALEVLLVAFEPAAVVIVATHGIVGSFLVVRRPGNAVGWLIVALGLTHVATTTRLSQDDVDRLAAGTADLALALRAWASAPFGSLSFVLYAAVAFVFPTGSLAGRPRRTSILVLLAVAVLVGVAPSLLAPMMPATATDGSTDWLVPNPFVLVPLIDATTADLWIAASVILPIIALACGVIDLARRYRKGGEVLRAQVRWLMAAVAFLVLALTWGLTVTIVVGPEAGLFAWFPAQLAFPTVPIAVGIAVMRYRLFEIDRIISRTLSWALMTGILLALFGGLVIGLQAALQDLIQGGGTLAVGISTLVAFALFQPIRRRIQGRVDRRFDRARYDGERTAAAFAERLRDEVDLISVDTILTQSVTHSLRPTSVGLWLRESER